MTGCSWRGIWRRTAACGAELAGLRWQDVDFDRNLIVVRQSRTVARRDVVTSVPKSGRPRVIDLDVDTMAVLAVSRRKPPADHVDDLVLRGLTGQPIHPDRISDRFDRLVRRCGLPRIRFHGLRHTHASLLLKAGVPIKVVSERLGHADPAFTMRIYQHVLPGMQAEAARVFAGVVHDAVHDGSTETVAA